MSEIFAVTDMSPAITKEFILSYEESYPYRLRIDLYLWSSDIALISLAWYLPNETAFLIANSSTRSQFLKNAERMMITSKSEKSMDVKGFQVCCKNMVQEALIAGVTFFDSSTNVV